MFSGLSSAISTRSPIQTSARADYAYRIAIAASNGPAAALTLIAGLYHIRTDQHWS
jgi:hypothetical protein